MNIRLRNQNKAIKKISILPSKQSMDAFFKNDLRLQILESYKGQIDQRKFSKLYDKVYDDDCFKDVGIIPESLDDLINICRILY